MGRGSKKKVTGSNIILPTNVKALVKIILFWERLIKIFQLTWLKAESRIKKKTKFDKVLDQMLYRRSIYLFFEFEYIF